MKKNVLITGASSGIGKELAHGFHDAGFNIIPCARRYEVLVDEFKNTDNCRPLKLDVTDYVKVKYEIENIINDFGRIDILINNASTLSNGKVVEYSVRDWIEIFDCNVTSVFNLCHEVLPYMIKNNFGRIINISSGGSVNCAPSYSAYSSTKAAINAFTKSVAKEVSDYDIKVNCMSPGPCRTPMFPENPLDPAVSLPTALKLASNDPSVGTGKFYWMEKEVPVIPDLSHVDWTDPDSL